MTMLKQSTAQKVAFVLYDASGVEVAGLGTAFVLAISKNGGAFAGSAGTKAEVSNGWYTYTFTAGETDTAGPLAVKITHASIDQINLIYEVSASGYEAPAGSNVLSVEEAANVLRCAQDDPIMLLLLPGIDAYLEQATGRAWQEDATVREEAKNAARMLLVRWHEDPGGMAAGVTLNAGLTAILTQLEALALTLETSAIPARALSVVGAYPSDGSDEVSVSVTPVLIFSNEMAAGAINQVSITGVVSTNVLDATGKIMTMTPGSALANATTYTLVLDAVTDVFGQTLTDEIVFTTED